MVATLPNFISHLMRPFSHISLGITSESNTPISIPIGAGTATVAAGCFWGVEHMFRQAFEGKGLYDARVGYIGGDLKDPDYRAVCSGETGRMFHIHIMMVFHHC